MKKEDMIEILVEKFGYEKDAIKLFKNAKLEDLILLEEKKLEEIQAPLEETNDVLNALEPLSNTRVSAKSKGVKDDDKILVMCGSSGGVGYYSERTHKRWNFNSFGEEDLMEYSELVAMRNKYPTYFTNGWIIILDREVQEEFKLTEMYKNIITPKNIDAVFNMKVDTLEKFIDSLPEGMKTTFVNKAIEKHEAGTLDSYAVIQFIQKKFNFSFEDNSPLNDIVSSVDTGTHNIIYIDKN